MLQFEQIGVLDSVLAIAFEQWFRSPFGGGFLIFTFYVFLYCLWKITRSMRFESRRTSAGSLAALRRFNKAKRASSEVSAAALLAFARRD